MHASFFTVAVKFECLAGLEFKYVTCVHFLPQDPQLILTIRQLTHTCYKPKVPLVNILFT